MAISLLPLLWELEQPLYMPQQFAYGLSPKELLIVNTIPRPRDYSRPWQEYFAWKAESAKKNSEKEIKKDLNNFQIHLELRHFAPEEISVKVVDGFIKIEAFHQERRDAHRLVTRQFVRRYALPDGCNENAVESRLSADGVLTVTAPVDGSERGVPRFLQKRAESLNEAEDKKFDKRKPQEEKCMEKKPEEKDSDVKESQKKQGVEKKPEKKDPDCKEPKEKDFDEKKADKNEPEEKEDVENGQ